MGFCVVHMQKMKMSAIGGIDSHINRKHESKTNTDIDYSKTNQNYSIGCICDDLRKNVKEIIDNFVDTKKAIRKDAVVCCNFIITSDNETMSNMSFEEQKDFFERSWEFFAERYGAETIAHATVHMDEKTPHMHLGVVPITEDGRLSAKSLFTPLELKQLQTDFAKEVGAQFGLERGIEGSTNKHIEKKILL